jgi:hypothetical protein
MTALRYYCDRPSFLVDKGEALRNGRSNWEAAWHVGTATGAAADTASMPAFAKATILATGGRSTPPAPGQQSEARRVSALLCRTWPAQELAKELQKGEAGLGAKMGATGLLQVLHRPYPRPYGRLLPGRGADAIHRALGCKGPVTDGGARDLDAVAPGFQVLCGRSRHPTPGCTRSRSAARSTCSAWWCAPTP